MDQLALIPPHTLALGVAVDRFDVELVFQLSEATKQDRRDINEIWENFEALVGDAINVTARHEVRQARDVSALDGIRWVYLARASHHYD